MQTDLQDFDPKLDLLFERTSKLSPAQIWRGWTEPALLKEWFCPKPWRVTECRIDLKPGGEFYTLMEGSNGEKMHNPGSYLEIEPGKKLVWTNMMTSGFRPAEVDLVGFGFVATILLTPTEGGSRYRAVIKHANEDHRKQHNEMGFQDGWDMALKQLEQLILR